MKVIINASHKLLPQQLSLLRDLGGDIETVPIPADGITTDEQQAMAERLLLGGGRIVFISPVPVLLGRLAALAATAVATGAGDISVYVLARDRREAIEGEGVVAHRIGADGWRLVRIV